MESFIKVILLQAGNYRSDHIMFTMGSDFEHENSHEWYKNLDKLMKYTMMKVNTLDHTATITFFTNKIMKLLIM